MKELDEIKQRIAEGKTKTSISQFRDFIESKSFDKRVETRAYYDKVILVSGRYSAIENEIRLGIIKKEDELVQRNRINNDLIQLVNQFPKVSDNTPVASGESISQRVKNISAQNEFKYDVFLSFSSKDKEAAISLYESLVGYGLRVFISSEYFKQNVGSSFQREIEYALRHSRSFLLFWTDNAKQSKWVEIEYMAFFQEFYMREGSERKFYIFRPENNFGVSLPLFLRQLQFTSSSRELIFSIIKEEEARINQAKEKQQTEEANKAQAQQEAQQQEAAEKAKAEKERKQKEEAARLKAEEEKRKQEEAAKAKVEEERKKQEAAAKAKAERERKRKAKKAKAKTEADKQREEYEAREQAEREQQEKLIAAKKKKHEDKRKADWERAKKQDTIESYGAFISKYGSGKFIPTAKKNLNLAKSTKKRRDAITKKAYQSNKTSNKKTASSSDGPNIFITILKFLLVSAFGAFIIAVGINLIIYLIEYFTGWNYPGGTWDYIIGVGAIVFSMINTALNIDDLD